MDDYQNGWGIDALDPRVAADRLQYNVRSGCEVSPGTNDLTVQVASGEITFDGNIVSVSAQDNISLAASESNPRKDVVYLDSSGTLQVATGTAEAAEPQGEVRRETYRPAPPDLSGTNAVVLAEVWVPAGTSDITAGDVSDRRVGADASLQSLSADDIDTGGYTSSYSASLERLLLQDPDSNQILRSGALETGYLFNGWIQAPLVRSINDVYMITGRGHAEHLASVDNTVGNVARIGTQRDGNWGVIYNDADNTFEFHSDATSLENHNPSWSDTSISHTPLAQGFQPFYEKSVGGNGYLMAEYDTNPSPGDVLSIYRALESNSSLTEVQSMTVGASNDGSHWHNLDADPHDSSYFVATTGHEGGKWWESTDYGASWTQVLDTDNQTEDFGYWTTTRIVFGDSGTAYWATDAVVNGAYKLVKAPKSDYSDITVLASIDAGGDTLKVLDICYFKDPHGIFFTPRDEDSPGNNDSLPVFFYDLDAGRLRHLRDISVVTGNASNRGMQTMFPYQLSGGGTVGWFRDRDYGTVGTELHTVEVPKAMVGD